MKKISILILITLITFSASAQMRSGSAIGKLKIKWYKTGWFFDGNAGARFIGETSNFAKETIQPTVNAGVGYFFNDKIALKGRLDAHKFTSKYDATTAYPGFEDRSLMASGSAEVMVRLLQVFAHKRSRDFALNFHAGAGLSALINPSFKKEIENNGGEYKGKLFNADNIGHIIVGLTPQYHLNSRVSINLDISQFTYFKQNYTFDSHNRVDSKDVTGIVGVSLGLTFRP